MTAVLDFISDNRVLWVILAASSYALWQIFNARPVLDSDEARLRRGMSNGFILQGMFVGALLTILALLIRLFDSM
jgi:hypothetical protein